MDDLKIIFWIIIGLVYLFTRSRKKAKPPVPQRQSAEEVDDTPAPNQPVTFEELLREIQGMKKVEEEPRPLPAPTSASYTHPSVKNEWKGYEPEPSEEKKQLEDANYDYRKHDKIYGIYDDAVDKAFLRPSLEETLKLKDTVVGFNQFKEYASDARLNLVQEYVKELKDPKGFRKAFIMSEILNRRF